MAFSATPVQSIDISGFATSVASNTMAATASGSLIVVLITVQISTGTSTSVTDNIGNTYTMVPLANPGNTAQKHKEIWYCLQAAAGVTSVTVNTGSGTAVNVAGKVREWAGGAASLRTQNSQNNTSSANPPACTVTPGVGDLIEGAFGYLEAVSGTRQDTAADTANYTYSAGIARGTTVSLDAYRIATSTTATGPTWTMSPAVSSAAVTAAFVPLNVVPASVSAVAATATAAAVEPAVDGAVTVSGGGPATATAAAIAPVVTATTAISKTNADPVGITDSVQIGIDGVRNQNDAVGVTDSVQTALSNPRSPSDSVGVTDTVTASIGKSVTISDSVGILDDANPLAGGPRSVTNSDNVGITDGITYSLTSSAFPTLSSMIRARAANPNIGGEWFGYGWKP